MNEINKEARKWQLIETSASVIVCGITTPLNRALCCYLS